MDVDKSLGYLYDTGFKTEEMHKKQVLDLIGDNFNHPYSMDLTFTRKRDVTVDKYFLESIPPVYSYKDNRDLVFEIPPDDYYYTDLSKTDVYLKVQIKDKDGKPYKPKQNSVDDQGNIIEVDTKTAVGNNFFSTMFKDFELKINSQTITPNNGNNPYTGYIHNNISYGIGSPVRNHQMCLKEKKFDSLDEKENPAFKILHELAQSGPFELLSKPAHGLFDQHRLLPPSTRISLTFKKNSSKFALMGLDDKFGETFEILDAKLRVCKVKINPAVEKMLQEDIDKGAQYTINFKDCQVHNYLIPAGEKEHVSEVLFSGENIPEAIVIGMVSPDAYEGKPSKSPFNFKHFNIRAANVSVNGQEQVFDDLKVNVDNGETAWACSQLNSMLPKSQGFNEITKEEFSNGYFWLCWDIRGGIRNERVVPPREGNLKLKLEFTKKTTEPIMVIVYSQTNRQMLLNNHTQYMNLY